MSNISSPPPADQSGGVRRHHTIGAASRATRTGSRVISEDDQQQQQGGWPGEDEVVDQDWVGGVGAVGEKSAALHRQASLPARYGVNRGRRKLSIRRSL